MQAPKSVQISSENNSQLVEDHLDGCHGPVAIVQMVFFLDLLVCTEACAPSCTSQFKVLPGLLPPLRMQANWTRNPAAR